MNLTYEIINGGKGYIIKNNGVNWIKQDTFIPYPAETIEQSAQNHIDAILAEQQAQQDELSEIERLKQENELIKAYMNEQQEALLDLANTIAEVIG